MPPPPNSDPASAAWLVQEVTTARVLDTVQISPYLAEFRSAHPAGGADVLSSFLIRAGVLTTFQAGRVLAGDAGRLVLGPYLLVEPLGTGSLGTVYQAVGRGDRKRYAVKVLPLRSLWNVHQAKKQVRAFADLPPHPAVVPFVDIDSAGGFHYLAWPYAAGSTLSAAIAASGVPSVTEALRVAISLADGLALLHFHDITHGLLKPSNVMLGADGQPRLIDLGVGAILTENMSDGESMLDTISTANAAMGMLDCLRPETSNDPNLRQPAGDIYSFGCVMHVLLTGHLPFESGNVIDKVIAHQTQPPPAPSAMNPTVPRWLDDIVARMLAKKPSDRPAAGQLLADLKAGAARLTAGRGGPTLAAVPAVEAPVPFAEAVDDDPDDNDGTEDADPAPPPPVSRPSIPAPKPVVKSPSLVDFNIPGDDTDAGISNAEAPRPARTDPTDRVRGASDPLLDSPSDVWKPLPAPAASRSRPVISRDPADPTPVTAVAPLADAAPPAPVWYAGTSDSATRRKVVIPPPPRFATSLARRIRQRLMFWKTPAADVVQLTIFGPPAVAPGESFKVQVFAHHPSAFQSVFTLSRAFHQDGELLATGYVQREVPRNADLGLHLAVANAGVARSLVQLNWLGQPQPRAFDVHVPWESPTGMTAAVLSAGVSGILAGQIQFTLLITPRKTS